MRQKRRRGDEDQCGSSPRQRAKVAVRPEPCDRHKSNKEGKHAQPSGAQRLLIVSTRVEYLETFIDKLTRAMRARAQNVRTDRGSEPRERRMLPFVGECSSVKQLHAGRDVGRLISCVAEYGICADDRQG